MINILKLSFSFNFMMNTNLGMAEQTYKIPIIFHNFSISFEFRSLLDYWRNRMFPTDVSIEEIIKFVYKCEICSINKNIMRKLL